MALERFGAISTAKMNNFEAVDAPGAGDDSGEGYGVGSVWVDITNNNVYMCVDASAAAAVWLQNQWINQWLPSDRQSLW